MMDVAIIDSGGANIASVQHALRRLGVRSELTVDPDVLRRADRVVLPGVGAASPAMQRLRDLGLIDVIRNLQQPVLGICLGMQLLFDASEEDDVDCLGILPGTAARMQPAPGLPVPNMGWCPITATDRHPLLDKVDDGSYFYFVHSYALPVNAVTLATAAHTGPFAAMAGRENFLAVQCHPEKSARCGAVLLQNFLGPLQ